MYALLDRPRPGWRVVHLDVEAIEHPVDLLAELLAALTRVAPLARLLQGLRKAPKSLLDRLRGTVDEVGAAGVKLKLRDEVKSDA